MSDWEVGSASGVHYFIIVNCLQGKLAIQKPVDAVTCSLELMVQFSLRMRHKQQIYVYQISRTFSLDSLCIKVVKSCTLFRVYELRYMTVCVFNRC